MTNLAHWQDDIDEALGGDFDGSLSGLCIMSLSFDFTRNANGSLANTSKENNATTNQSNGLLSIAGTSGNKATTSIGCGVNDAHNDSSNHFSKRFKQYHSTSSYDEENRSNSQNKIALQLQQLKNCLNTSSLNTNGTLTTHYSSVNHFDNQQHQICAASKDTELDRLSPQSSETSCNRASAISTPDDSSRSSTAGIRSPSPAPSQTCSSISTHSRTSSRSQSPSDMSLHGCNNNNLHNAHQSGRNGSKQSGPDQTKSQNNDQQVSLYSVKDNLLNGSTLKESSYTTSVITTTAPMHFKSIHHPFSIKQFPLSPYHQFSNSSLNHDFYDRYLSHDSHQPLQTPLIGIERTQDLLSLKLPPHGPSEDIDSHRFSKEWSFEETKNDSDQNKMKSTEGDKAREDISSRPTDEAKRKESSGSASNEPQKGFSFNYKSNSSIKSNVRTDKDEPIDLNISYEQEACCDVNQEKSSIFDESMKHFNPERIQQNACCDHRSKDHSSSPEDDQHQNECSENVATIAHQFHGQESMFGIDPSKQKFQHILAAPISVATKLNEDTITYLNQGQAYEIKLENMTDVSEARKGFMCSIINIGFHERHMQQAENELWHQWSEQHPNEKIFSVDMKLSYNVFGVESDGLNKYEFLWDSSKAAGVFIRINSISTEFTPKKHGGEKGVPFKLSIETFSYNSKTHDSFFISAACCQIKVFKPKGAERKIRSDRDKISKRPLSEQDKYHRSCDLTTFRECSLTSLHPMADGSLCYYRHSHGHFASKQVVSSSSAGGTPSIQAHHNTEGGLDGGNNNTSNGSQHEQSHKNDGSIDQITTNHVGNESSESSSNCHGSRDQREYHGNQSSRSIPLLAKDQQHSDYSPARSSHHHYHRGSLDQTTEPTESNFGTHTNQHSTSDINFSHSSNDLLQLPQSTPFNQMYHSNQVRGAAGLAGLGTPQHFGMPFYGHTLPTPLPTHIPAPTSYGMQPNSSLTPNVAHPSHINHNFSIPPQQHIAVKGAGSIYRPFNPDKQLSATSNSHVTPFKAANLAITNHNNFQSYLSHQTDQCIDTPQEMKDGSPNGGNYQHDNYDLHHSFPSSSSHVHQQPLRQRSASTSMTTHGHCAGYVSHFNQNKHIEGYISQNNTALETATSNNHWVHAPNNHSQVTSPNSSCTQRSGSNTLPQNHDSHAFASGNNYDCNNDNYNSESSPKNHHHTNDTTTSCYSRIKNSSNSMISCPSQQDQYEQDKLQNQHNTFITASSNCNEVMSWITGNRFGHLIKTFNNFNGSDLLRLSKTEFIEICGLIDGIRLYNNLHNQPIKPRRVLYVRHITSEIFQPIYLYDVTLKELLRELSVVFRTHFLDVDARSTGENLKKNVLEKSALNSGTSTDSRSSMSALSTETASEDIYNHNEHFFNEVDSQHRQGKCSASNSDNNCQKTISIDRLLIDGITSVKIVATEQLLELENESVWALSLNCEDPYLIEACLSDCRKRAPK